VITQHSSCALFLPFPFAKECSETSLFNYLRKTFCYRDYRKFGQEVGYDYLADRREALPCKFSIKTIRPDSCIHHLIPKQATKIYFLD